ncbi:hypothetical protein TNCV_3517151 [Trichonephila clavipes]|nr:hypothetical protein TNCV_3517151 [Trichonephila clavipes]
MYLIVHLMEFCAEFLVQRSPIIEFLSAMGPDPAAQKMLAAYVWSGDHRLRMTGLNGSVWRKAITVAS